MHLGHWPLSRLSEAQRALIYPALSTHPSYRTAFISMLCSDATWALWSHMPPHHPPFPGTRYISQFTTLRTLRISIIDSSARWFLIRVRGGKLLVDLFCHLHCPSAIRAIQLPVVYNHRWTCFHMCILMLDTRISYNFSYTKCHSRR
jgi:hypothetical protein